MIKKLLFTSLVGVSTLYGETLSELINLSQNNAHINGEKLQVEALNEEYKSYKNSNLPNIEIGGTYIATNQETISVPNNGTSAYAKASFVLYDGDKRSSQYESYEYNIKSSNYKLEQTKNNIALSIVAYYFNYQTLISQKEAKQKEIETLQAQKQRLENFLAVGNITSDQVDKIDSSLQGAIVASHEIELQIQTVLHDLQYITGKEITISDKASINTNTEQKIRADIKALEAASLAQLSNVESAKSGLYPQITINDTYSMYDYNYDNNDYTNPENQNIASINLAWNIFDFGATKQKANAQYKQYLASQKNLEYEKNKANIELKLALKSYEIAKLKIEAAHANVKAANSTFEVIESQYQNGVMDNVTYLDALSSKYNAQSVYEKSKNDLEIQKAKILYYSGANIQEFIQ